MFLHPRGFSGGISKGAESAGKTLVERGRLLAEVKTLDESSAGRVGGGRLGRPFRLPCRGNEGGFGLGIQLDATPLNRMGSKAESDNQSGYACNGQSYVDANQTPQATTCACSCCTHASSTLRPLNYSSTRQINCGKESAGNYPSLSPAKRFFGPPEYAPSAQLVFLLRYPAKRNPLLHVFLRQPGKSAMPPSSSARALDPINAPHGFVWGVSLWSCQAELPVSQTSWR
jgi:hypothetical protein